jgi:hypothetical protein
MEPGRRKVKSRVPVCSHVRTSAGAEVWIIAQAVDRRKYAHCASRYEMWRTTGWHGGTPVSSTRCHHWMWYSNATNSGRFTMQPITEKAKAPFLHLSRVPRAKGHRLPHGNDLTRGKDSAALRTCCGVAGCRAAERAPPKTIRVASRASGHSSAQRVLAPRPQLEDGASTKH